jgi:hypothetical protein
MKHQSPVDNHIDHQEFTFFRVLPSGEDQDENAALIEIVRTWQNKNTPLLLENVSKANQEHRDSIINSQVPF